LKREQHTVHFACTLSAIGFIYVPVVSKFDVSNLTAQDSKPIQLTCDDRWRVFLLRLNFSTLGQRMIIKFNHGLFGFDSGLFNYSSTDGSFSDSFSDGKKGATSGGENRDWFKNGLVY
jgi:hypothetical protein